MKYFREEGRFLSIFTKGGKLVSIIILLIACVQLQCSTPKQNTNMKVENNVPNTLNNNNNKDVRVGKLQLELRSDRTKLAPGDCTDLHLDAVNNLARPIHWGTDWILEQDVPFPLPPESAIRGARELPLGKTSDLIKFRICHEPNAHLVAGIYRLRISTARTSATPASSNWTSIEVLP